MGSSTAAGTTIAISAALPTSQTILGYAALTFIKIARVENIGAIGATVGKTEFEPLDGPKEKHKASVDYGSLTPTMAHDNDDAGQSLLRVAAEPENHDEFAYCVTYPTGDRRYFQARTFGYPENVGNKQSIITAVPTIEICTAVVKAAAGAPTLPLNWLGISGLGALGISGLGALGISGLGALGIQGLGTISVGK